MPRHNGNVSHNGPPAHNESEDPMPTITADTPREDYTIAGETFSILQPYTEGHVLSANEAATLNQTWSENARNNFAKRVKDAKEAGTFDQASLQLSLDDYLESYEFGVRTGGGGRTSDPVAAEALAIAKESVKKALQKKGAILKDYSAKDITDLAKQVLARGDATSQKIQALAEQRVAAAKEIDIEADVSDAPAPEAKPAKAKKAEATT